MDIDPVFTGIVGVAGLIALGLAVLWFRKRAELLSLPVVPVDQAAGHRGEAVVVGRAAGEQITSPWTERNGVFFSASEIVEERRNNTGNSQSRSTGSGSQRRRRTHDLGEVGMPLTLSSKDGESTVMVQPDGDCAVEHLPKMRTASTGGGSGLNIQVGGLRIGDSNQRVWVEEHAAHLGDQLYVAGTLTDQGGQPAVTGKVSLATKDPSAQGQSLLLRSGIAGVIAVAALGFAVFALTG